MQQMDGQCIQPLKCPHSWRPLHAHAGQQQRLPVACSLLQAEPSNAGTAHAAWQAHSWGAQRNTRGEEKEEESYLLRTFRSPILLAYEPVTTSQVRCAVSCERAVPSTPGKLTKRSMGK